MTLSDTARQAINDNIKRARAKMRKKEMARDKLIREIETLQIDVNNWDKDLED